ncbi:MAG: hypothetical protein LH479_00680 [Polaromonas sp.]|nr:hypothetical protein [Polaromonas sp.]
MNHFNTTLIRRNTALVMLLMWLFALASGVANACLLEAHMTHAPVALAGSSEVEHAPVPWSAHSVTVAEHDDASHPAKMPCLKVCDEGSRALQKQDLTIIHAEPGPATLVAVLWITSDDAAPLPRRMDTMQPVAPDRPIRVRYSRLAL